MRGQTYDCRKSWADHPSARKEITPGRNWPVRGTGGLGLEENETSDRLVLMWSPGERGRVRESSPGRSRCKQLPGDCSVILIPVQWITAIQQIAGRKSPWENSRGWKDH